MQVFQTTLTRYLAVAFTGLMMSLVTNLVYAQVPVSPVSERKIVEIRARGVNLGERSPGHVMVFLGTEYDDGLVIWDRIGGFYPEKGGLNSLWDNGEVTVKELDLIPTDSVRYPISESQASMINSEMSNWDDSSYVLAGQNCVDFAMSVLDHAGVNTNGMAHIPGLFILELRSRKQTLENFEEFRTSIEAIEASLVDVFNERVRVENIRIARIETQWPRYREGLERAAEARRRLAEQRRKYLAIQQLRNDLLNWMNSDATAPPPKINPNQPEYSEMPPPIEFIAPPDGEGAEILPEQQPVLNPWLL